MSRLLDVRRWSRWTVVLWVLASLNTGIAYANAWAYGRWAVLNILATIGCLLAWHRSATEDTIAGGGNAAE